MGTSRWRITTFDKHGKPNGYRDATDEENAILNEDHNKASKKTKMDTYVDSGLIKSIQYMEGGFVQTSRLAMLEASTALKPGAYAVELVPGPGNTMEPGLFVFNFQEDQQLHDFAHKEDIENAFAAFFSAEKRQRIKDLKFFHKMGILLYGIQGTGKTTIIKHYCKKFIPEHNALVFFLANHNMHHLWAIIKRIRKIQDNPIIAVMEEFENNVRDAENAFKNILDGYDTVDDTLIIATTNYIDRVPDTIKNRPSRFKYVIEIKGIENLSTISEIVSNMLRDAYKPEEIQAFAKKLKGSTLDDIKHFCLDKILDINTVTQDRKRIGFL